LALEFSITSINMRWKTISSSVKQTLKHSQIKAIKKAAFLDTVELYKARSGAPRQGFNEFILAALKQMKDYEVADDLEAYKALLSVLPRGGRLKAKSFLHADMGAYKQQQDTVTRLLMQLNDSIFLSQFVRISGNERLPSCISRLSTLS
uniref:ECSIT domain-containing protein n=1 Tax=Rodentolepis nana TaxID=102285 RepID=A0A0R3T7N5_RODNA